VEVGSVAAVIGLMPEQRKPGFFGCLPRHFARAPQQIDFCFDSQTDEICHLAHKIGISARRLPVISDQTYTFLAHHRFAFYHNWRESKISPKGIAPAADKHNKQEMLPGLTTVSLPQTYCRACHLSTRSDVVRCLHCNRPLNPVPAPKTAPRKSKTRRTH
jgi:hypothetical protein